MTIHYSAQPPSVVERFNQLSLSRIAKKFGHLEFTAAVLRGDLQDPSLSAAQKAKTQRKLEKTERQSIQAAIKIARKLEKSNGAVFDTNPVTSKPVLEQRALNKVNRLLKK